MESGWPLLGKYREERCSFDGCGRGITSLGGSPTLLLGCQVGTSGGRDLVLNLSHQLAGFHCSLNGPNTALPLNGFSSSPSDEAGLHSVPGQGCGSACNIFVLFGPVVDGPESKRFFWFPRNSFLFWLLGAEVWRMGLLLSLIFFFFNLCISQLLVYMRIAEFVCTLINVPLKCFDALISWFSW